MTPSQFLESLCRRTGLAPRQAEPLLPLVQLAWTARPAVRRRILDEIERTLRRLAEESPDPAAVPEGDQRLLSMMAGLLHRWDAGAAG